MKHPALSYVAPFVTYLIVLGIGTYSSLGLGWTYPLGILAVLAVLVIFSKGALSWRLSQPLQSIVVGLLVFAIWVGPDLVWPGYREYWVFANPVTGVARSSLSEALRTNYAFLFFRTAGSILVIPVIEELFWRAWLMRYLVSSDFQNVGLGTFSGFSFWVTALLFASEHGPYWDVGLVAGIAYSLTMIRTRKLADCILAHSITNACLALYVLDKNQWQYWL